MNQVPKPVSADEDALSPDAPRPATNDKLIALFREISDEAQARGLSMNRAEIDEEIAPHKAERRT
jgi:hypothetical protein